MENAERAELFSQVFPFWDKMSQIDKETFCRSSYHMNFRKGVNIHDGNECTAVIIIKSGSLRL